MQYIRVRVNEIGLQVMLQVAYLVPSISFYIHSNFTFRTEIAKVPADFSKPISLRLSISLLFYCVRDIVWRASVIDMCTEGTARKISPLSLCGNVAQIKPKVAEMFAENKP